MPAYHHLQLDLADGVATVWLNRPEVRNAFNAEMIAEATGVFEALDQDERVRVIVLRGRGRSFSAGADIAWMRSSLEFSTQQNRADAHRMFDMFATIDRCPKPVVAAVHGAALGGGMGLLAVSDVVVAARDTVFGFTEVKLGIIPAVISGFVLPKIGESWARALFLTGERFDVEVAQRTGLVHQAVDPGDLEQAVQTKVDELLTSGPVAVREAKALIAALRHEGGEGIRSLTAERIATLRTGAEGQEGLRAFLDKRAAEWRGRPER